MKKSRVKMKLAKNNFYFLKWMFFIAVYLIAGGVLAFSLILISINIIDGAVSFNPVWIVGMVPLMMLIAIPITIIIYRQVSKNLIPLVSGMERVAGGDLDTYIPTAEAKDFAKVYENFNKMVAEIQSIETLRANMFDNLSHELKTPIASINGFSHILAEKELSEEKKKQYLQIIIDESERLSNLVKNVLLLSKLDSIEIVSHKEAYSLTAQLQDCVISLENDWTAKNINISADLDDCMYNGEPQLMKSLWLNLINNAIKYTPENGEVNIMLTADDNDITVSFSDTGVGINEDDLTHIFEKHYQSDKRITGGGQGLGLPIVKRIVKLCGGTITVTSKINEGSVFTVVLPK